jgi:hypothetical protein
MGVFGKQLVEVTVVGILNVSKKWLDLFFISIG